jgi:hypothetical protein
MIEHEKREASGTAKTALGLSIGALGAELLTGGLNGLIGGWGNGANGSAPYCHENMPVNRYEAAQNARIAQLETEVKLRDSNIYTDKKSLELYQYFDGELKNIRGELGRQAVHNQRTEDSFVLAQRDLAAVKSDLEGKIRMEAERRCCADNAIVNYVNATFYPKMVSDVTVGTTTTAQTLYNPLPDCGCGCGK